MTCSSWSSALKKVKSSIWYVNKDYIYIYIIYFVYAFLFKHQESVCEFRQVVTM